MSSNNDLPVCPACGERHMYTPRDEVHGYEILGYEGDDEKGNTTVSPVVNKDSNNNEEYGEYEVPEGGGARKKSGKKTSKKTKKH